MVRKAAAEVTITDETDILSLVTWYQLSSSATAPDKPTTTSSSATPSGWSTNEPSFDPAQGTKYLYTVVQTRWKDGTCTWDAPVQLSSSYEQAKQAWNKANAAQESVTTLSNSYNTLSDTVNEHTVKVGEFTAQIYGYYAKCPTAAATAAKVATIDPEISGFSVHAGTTVAVKFENANTASSPTLNVNGTGAKAIKGASGENLTSTERQWDAGSLKLFVYDGTNWCMQSESALERLSSAETVVQQTANNVLIQATRNDATASAVGATLISSLINVAPDDIKIEAEHIQITGTAVFNAINNDTGQTKIDGGKIDATSITIGASTLPEAVLRYDITYSYDEDPTTHKKVSATFTAHLYQGATDIKTSYPESCFTWFLKSEDWVQGEPMSPLTSNGDYTCTVLLADVGYGATVVGRFEPPNDAIALDDDDNTLVDDDDVPISVRVPSGDYVRIADLEVAATVFNADKMLVVTSEGEKLATVSTLKAVFGTSSYDDLTNRPQIEGVTLTGDKSFSDLGIFMTDSQGYSVPDEYTLTTMEINALWANAAPIGA